MNSHKFEVKLLENSNKIPATCNRCVLKPYESYPTMLQDFKVTPLRTVIGYVKHYESYLVYFDYKNKRGVVLSKLQFRKYFLEEQKIWI
jgi:hypothetical protein